jgi:RNA recognition motif-containing protein
LHSEKHDRILIKHANILTSVEDMRIYVGNLSYDVTDDELRQLFADFGEVTSVSIPIDRDSGRPRGYGFIDMPDQGQAEAAILALNGKAYKDRPLTVNEARPRAEAGGGGRQGGYRMVVQAGIERATSACGPSLK